MRVITGSAKGRKLRAPKGMETRPTSDRVKEALFNILGSRVVDANFLDLYAGTGSIGIEALSRGAKRALFVEHNAIAYKIIFDNLNLTGFLQKAEVYRQDAQRALDLMGRRGCRFDIVFIDPPYLKSHEIETLENLCNHNLIKKDTIVVVERSTRDQIPDTVMDLKLYREESYGDTTLSFYQASDKGWTSPDKGGDS